MRVIRCLTIAVAATLVVGEAQAQNLVANGDFDTDLAGWYVSPSWILDSWSSFDAGGSPSSGSLRQENVNDDGIKGLGTGQCVPVVEGTPYRVGFSVYVPSGQTGIGLAGLHFAFFTSVDCDSGSEVGGLYGTNGDWVEFDEWSDWSSSPVVAPAGAQSMVVDTSCRKSSTTGTFAAYWDDVSVVPEPHAAAVNGIALLALSALRRLARGADGA